MKCPYCQQQMQEGFLSSRSPVFWSEEVSGLPLPARKGDLLLGGCDSFAGGKKSAHGQRFSVVRRTDSLIGGMTG